MCLEGGSCRILLEHTQHSFRAITVPLFNTAFLPGAPTRRRRRDAHGHGPSPRPDLSQPLRASSPRAATRPASLLWRAGAPARSAPGSSSLTHPDLWAMQGSWKGGGRAGKPPDPCSHTLLCVTQAQSELKVDTEVREPRPPPAPHTLGCPPPLPWGGGNLGAGVGPLPPLPDLGAKSCLPQM